MSQSFYQRTLKRFAELKATSNRIICVGYTLLQTTSWQHSNNTQTWTHTYAQTHIYTHSHAKSKIAWMSFIATYNPLLPYSFSFSQTMVWYTELQHRIGLCICSNSVLLNAILSLLGMSSGFMHCLKDSSL